jgi:hypothetical protein
MIDIRRALETTSDDWEKQTAQKWLNKLNLELDLSKKGAINDTAYIATKKAEETKGDVVM